MNKKKKKIFFLHHYFLVAFYQFFFYVKHYDLFFILKKYLKRLFPLNHLATISFFFVFYNFLLLTKNYLFCCSMPGNFKVLITKFAIIWLWANIIIMYIQCCISVVCANGKILSIKFLFHFVIVQMNIV